MGSTIQPTNVSDIRTNISDLSSSISKKTTPLNENIQSIRVASEKQAKDLNNLSKKFNNNSINNLELQSTEQDKQAIQDINDLELQSTKQTERLNELLGKRIHYSNIYPQTRTLVKDEDFRVINLKEIKQLDEKGKPKAMCHLLTTIRYQKKKLKEKEQKAKAKNNPQIFTEADKQCLSDLKEIFSLLEAHGISTKTTLLEVTEARSWTNSIATLGRHQSIYAPYDKNENLEINDLKSSACVDHQDEETLKDALKEDNDDNELDIDKLFDNNKSNKDNNDKNNMNREHLNPIDPSDFSTETEHEESASDLINKKKIQQDQIKKSQTEQSQNQKQVDQRYSI